MNNLYDEEQNTSEVITLPAGVGADMVRGGDKALQQIKTSYTTAIAVQVPRILAEVERRCLEEATLAGEGCYYGWGVKGEKGGLVEGPSIGAAMIMIRNYGNCVIELAPVNETPDSFIFTSFFVDLETGVTLPRQFRISKSWTVYGKMDAERKMDVRFQIGQSKCIRNTILKALPTWLVDKVVETAKKGVREKIEKFIAKKGMAEARQIAFEALKKQGVSQENAEHRHEKKYGAWDIKTLVMVQGDIKALQDGIETANGLYPDKPEEVEKGKLSADDMKAGDPDKHQGYDNEPKDEKPETKKGKVKDDKSAQTSAL